MFLLLAFMSDAMELCVGAKVEEANHKGDKTVFVLIVLRSLEAVYCMDCQKKPKTDFLRFAQKLKDCVDVETEQMLIR